MMGGARFCCKCRAARCGLGGNGLEAGRADSQRQHGHLFKLNKDLAGKWRSYE